MREFLCDSWLLAIEGTLRETTYRSYADTVRIHIVPKLGHLRLVDLGPEHLNAAYGELSRSGRRDGRGLSPRSVGNVHVVVGRALRDAVRWQLIAPNAAHDADPPRSARRTMAYWRPDELRVFLDVDPGDRLQPFWTAAITTGARRGELCGLAWDAVDLDAGRISITATLVVVGNTVTTSEPKTPRSRRSISLDASTVAALRAWRKRQTEERLAAGPAWHDSGLVFTAPDGQALHPKHVSWALNQRARCAGLSPIRFHDLRHSFASAALAAGEHPRAVADRLGHSSTQITNDPFSHVSREVEESVEHRVAASILGGEQR